MKTGDKILIVLLGVAFLASSILVWYHRSANAGTVAVVVSDGIEVRRIDLAQVKEPFTFTVPHGDDDYNVIRVEPGRIRVIEATCPDKIDVLQGWISDSTRTIVCLPNRLVIYIEAQPEPGDIDGIAY